MPLPPAADNKYVVVMTATPAVDEAFGNPLALATAYPHYASDAVFVEYIVSCERDHCTAPQLPPPPPPSPPMPKTAPSPPSSPSSPPMCAYGLVGQGSGETSTVTVYTQAAEAKAADAAQCYLTVEVKNTDFDQAAEYIINTTANGVEVHGKCSPLDGAVVDEDGYFQCARRVALPFAADGLYEFVTTASAEVEEASNGNYVVVDYTVHCVSDECRHRELATCLYTAYAAEAYSLYTAADAAEAKPELCASWCADNTAAWSEKCYWGKRPCLGCLECTDALHTDALASPLTIVTAPHTMDGSCYLKVELRTDYLSNSDEHVITTTANGQVVGTCSQWAQSAQSDGFAAAVANGTFKCVDSIALPASEDGVFTLLTNVTAMEGVADPDASSTPLYVAYTVSCTDSFCKPALPPSPPPSPPPSSPPPPRSTRLCYVTVLVKNTDYDAANKYVVNTTANGVEVHGVCSPPAGTPILEC